MKDLISIIVPVYNSEKFLEECVGSILAQTYTNLQVILVDDVSTDKSGEICDDFARKDTRVEVIHRKKNGGQSAARNTGLKQVKGEWIAFADNDDTLEPTMLETLLNNAIKYNVKVSGCANKRIENGATKICNLNGADSGTYSTQKIIYNILINPCDTWVEIWSKLYHASLADKLHFPQGCQLEDYMVNLPLMLDEKMVYFDNTPLYNWHIRPTSQSAQNYFENRKTYYSTSEKLRNLFIKKNAPDCIVSASYVWEYGVKAKLLQDMCSTKNKQLIAEAKSFLPKVLSLRIHAKKCKDFKLKSDIHILLRLIIVKFS